MEFIERALQEAADRGEFDAGNSAGRPIRIDDTGPGWWGRREAARIAESERHAAVLGAVERSLGQVWRLPTESAVRARVDELNATLRSHSVSAAEFDVEDVVRTWMRMARLRTHRPKS